MIDSVVYHGPQRIKTAARTRAKSSQLRRTILLIFLISLCIPIFIYLGTLRLSPYRIVLLCTIIPIFFMWASGQLGGRYFVDYLIIFHTFWVVVAHFKAHGFSVGIEPAGIYVVEFFGSYLLGRYCIRNASDFQYLAKLAFYVLLFFIPFAIIESSLKVNIILDYIISPIFQTLPFAEKPPRWGFYRARIVFDHPILYGVFCVSLFGLIYYLHSKTRRLFHRILFSIPVFVTTFFSLSAGPFVALVAQIGFVAWDVTTRWMASRWIVLLVCFILFYVIIDLGSNRTPFEVFISYLTFNQGNAYNRVWIWYFGTAEVMRQPFFGIGLNDWLRAYWMSPSMDNYWLYVAVRFGLPALIFSLLAIILAMVSMSRRKFVDPILRDSRKAWCMMMISFFVAGSTVHYWNALFSLAIFLVASGMWMLSVKDDKAARSHVIKS